MATGISENGILEQKEFDEFKSRTVRLRFQQQISYGIGAAMVFGLVGAIATKLFAMVQIAGVGLSVASIAPILGLAAIGALGIGCIYMSANYLSENTLLEQDLQAKKIGLAARGPSPTIEPASPGTTGLPNMETQLDTVSPDKRWTERVVPQGESLQKAPPAAASESWAQRAANDDQHATATTIRA